MIFTTYVQDVQIIFYICLTCVITEIKIVMALSVNYVEMDVEIASIAQIV